MKLRQIALFAFVFSFVNLGFSATARSQRIAPVLETPQSVTKPILDQPSESTKHGWNLKTQPLLFIVGALNFDVERDLTHGWTLEGSVIRASGNVYLLKYSATAYGLLITKYFAQTSFADAWYLGAMGYSIRGESSVDLLGAGYGGDVTVTAIAGRGGYQWMWDHFNMQLGLFGGVLANFPIVGLNLSLGWAI